MLVRNEAAGTRGVRVKGGVTVFIDAGETADIEPEGPLYVGVVKVESPKPAKAEPKDK